MIKLSYILQEARKGIQNISEEEAIAFIRNNCANNLRVYNEKMRFVYRGTRLDGEYNLVDPSQRERKSANTYNYYTLMIDNFPEWKEFPKRSKSLICTTDKGYTFTYGVPFIVLPVDEAKFGECPDTDIWDSLRLLNKKYGFYNADQFMVILNKLFTIATKKPIETYHNLIEIMQQIAHNGLIKEKIIKELNNDENDYFSQIKIKRFVLHMMKKDNLLTLRKILDPQTNGFQLKNLSNINYFASREVWTSDKCLLIRCQSLQTDEKAQIRELYKKVFGKKNET